MTNIAESLDVKIHEVMKNVIAPLVPHLPSGASISSGKPLLVLEYKGSKQYWKVPVVEDISGTRRHIGFFDLTDDASNPGNLILVRYNAVPLNAKGTLASSNYTVLTEMNKSEVVKLATEKSGRNSTLAEEPKLVFLGAATKVAWKCSMINPEGVIKDIFVTHGIAFEI